MRPAKRQGHVGAWLMICFLLLPITIVFPISVTDQDYLALPVHHLSLQWYANLFTSPQAAAPIIHAALQTIPQR